MTKKFCFLDWSKPYIALFLSNIMITAQYCTRVRQLVYHSCQVPTNKSRNPDDFRFKSNDLIGQCIFLVI